MSKALIYSCVTGNYDNVLSAVLASRLTVEDDVQYVLYTDRPDLAASNKSEQYLVESTGVTWELRPLLWKHPLCQRRTARWHKVNSHLVSKADYSMWIDGSQCVKRIMPYQQLILPYMKGQTIATFKHPERICVYQEMNACAKLKKDNVKLMRRQMLHYRSKGYPVFNGMVETACVIRENCKEVTNFNKLWWDQIQKYSYRDQLSFNYAAWELDMPYGTIPGMRSSSAFFEFVNHHK